MTLGDGTGPEAAIRFTSPAVERGILIHPELRFGEAYARFARMWEFYLAAAEMAFREQAMMVFQLQNARAWCR
jgi:hypothetical protein